MEAGQPQGSGPEAKLFVKKQGPGHVFRHRQMQDGFGKFCVRGDQCVLRKENKCTVTVGTVCINQTWRGGQECDNANHTASTIRKQREMAASLMQLSPLLKVQYACE